GAEAPAGGVDRTRPSPEERPRPPPGPAPLVQQMTWLIANWRLKLLALGLALGLLGAVAFSENPVSVTSVPAVVDYDNKDPSLVVLNPVLKTNVNVFGVSSAVDPLKASANFPNGVRFHVD